MGWHWCAVAIRLRTVHWPINGETSAGLHATQSSFTGSTSCGNSSPMSSTSDWQAGLAPLQLSVKDLYLSLSLHRYEHLAPMGALLQ